MTNEEALKKIQKMLFQSLYRDYYICRFEEDRTSSEEICKRFLEIVYGIENVDKIMKYYEKNHMLKNKKIEEQRRIQRQKERDENPPLTMTYLDLTSSLEDFCKI